MKQSGICPGNQTSIIHFRTSVPLRSMTCSSWEAARGAARHRPRMRDGRRTARLAEYLPGRSEGSSSSAEMLERAEKLSRPGLKFEKAAIEDVTGTWDLIFSNAAIQWIDNHQELIPQLYSQISAGGQLAVQLPSNHKHPAHTIIIEIALEEPFRKALGGLVPNSPVLSISEYAELLYAQGGVELTVFEKICAACVGERGCSGKRTSGTALIPYFERLPVNLKEAFFEIYRARLRERFPALPVFYPFQRTFFSVVHPV